MIWLPILVMKFSFLSDSGNFVNSFMKLFKKHCFSVDKQ
jgi:hypothetical protein